MFLQRKAYQKILDWKKRSCGSTALLLNGARRVGKSYLAEHFAKQEYRSYILVDFSKLHPDVKLIFESHGHDIQLFLTSLSLFYGVNLFERQSVIIFDEVQLYPQARQMIKHLVADGRYDYMETGSLLSIKQNVSDILIPSEEEGIEVFPLDFEEFLLAMGNESLYVFIKKCFDALTPLGQALHGKAMENFRTYMLVGGMPQAVLEYVNTRDFEKVDRIKRNILNLYRADIGKYAGVHKGKVSAIFDSLPGQLSKKEKKYKLSSIDKNARQRAYEDAFMWLSDGMIVNPCFNATDPGFAIGLSLEHTTQKIYLADTGLLVTHAFGDGNFIHNEIYKGILLDKLNINEGMIMENVIAQTFRATGYRLFFYSRSNAHDRKNNIEIDFMIRHKNKPSPVEVKSSSYKKHSSLDKFRVKFEKKIGESFLLYQKDVMVKDGVIHLPLYMGIFL